MAQIKKHDILNVILIFIGILIGTTLTIALVSHGEKKLPSEALSHEAIEKSQLLMKQYIALNEEKRLLEEEIKTLTSTSETDQKIEKARESLETELGIRPISGEGIQITLPKNLPSYAFVDLQNDLFTLNIKAWAINSIRITHKTAFLNTQGKTSINEDIIEAPYTIDILGDIAVIEQNIRKGQSFLSKIQNTYHIEAQDIFLEKKWLEIPAQK